MRVMRMQMQITIMMMRNWKSPLMKRCWEICLLVCIKTQMTIQEIFRGIVKAHQVIIVDQKAIHQALIEEELDKELLAMM